MKRCLFAKIVAPLVPLLALAGCGANDYYVDYEAEDYADYQAEGYNGQSISWQEAYADLLRSYHGWRGTDCGNFYGSCSFFLYDMDMSGIPELFVANINDAAFVYAFRDGEVIALEHWQDGALIALLRGAARTRIGATPEGELGFVFMWRGASGRFGTSAFYKRIVIDGDKLVVACYGEWYIDVVALYEKLGGSGIDVDSDTLEAIISEHTHITINGYPATEEEFRRIFSGKGEPPPFELSEVSEESISTVIFGQ